MITLLALLAVGVFNDPLIFKDPIGYPRASETSFSANTAQYLGHRILYFDASIGRQVPIHTFDIDDDFKAQLVLEGTTWLSLGYKDGAFPLLTQDFHFAVGAAGAKDRLTWMLRFNHISAHLGDGIDDLVYESLSKQEKADYDEAESHGVEPELVEPRSYSRDFISAHVTFGDTWQRMNRRFHLQAGYAHKMIPKHLGRWYFGGGTETEWLLNRYDFAIFFAQDLTYNQDMDSFDYSARAGTMLGNENSNYDVRIALTAYRGSDRRGQLLGRKLTQFGLGLFIR